MSGKATNTKNPSHVGKLDEVPRAPYNHLLDVPSEHKGKYHIREMFSTVQGEGEFCGVKSLFIRFTGCNMGCTFCDTDFTYGESYTLTELLDKIDILHGEELPVGGFKHIVLTGGEPLLQVNQALLFALIRRRFVIQVETNGTVPMPKLDPSILLSDHLFITCSPKKPLIHKGIADHISELKIVHFHEDFTNEVLDKYGRIFNERRTNIYIQPCERNGGTNIREVFEYVMGQPLLLKISVQIQKIANFE